MKPSARNILSIFIALAFLSFQLLAPYEVSAVYIPPDSTGATIGSSSSSSNSSGSSTTSTNSGGSIGSSTSTTANLGGGFYSNPGSFGTGSSYGGSTYGFNGGSSGSTKDLAVGIAGSAVGCVTGPLIAKGVAALSTAIGKLFKVGSSKVPTSDSTVQTNQSIQAYVTNCLNGLAVGLAKYQLEQVTTKVVRWAQTGVHGNPLYVQDMDTLINTTQKIALIDGSYYLGKEQHAADVCTQWAVPDNNPNDENDPAYDQNGNLKCLQYGGSNPQYPYGRSFAQAQINLARTGAAINNALIQDLSNYLVTEATPGNSANNSSVQAFSTNFAQGGWDGWLAYTQHDQNNPLGFNLMASQDMADKLAKIATDKAAEVSRNGGIQDQKKCVKYATPDNDPNDENDPAYNDDGTLKCLQYITVTPGSIIKDEVSNQISSPTRQLELVQTLNDALIGWFESLVDNFNGPEGLGAPLAPITNPFNDGLGISVSVDPNGNLITTNAEPNPTSTGSFDLMHDLGDTYNSDGSIDNRGVLQVQQDYVDGANKALTVLPKVLQGLGNLDYCIPGPTPAWGTVANQSLSTLSAQSTNNTDTQYWNNVGQNLLPEYQAKIDATYGPNSPMQNQTLPDGSTNTSYLEMSPAGLNLVKDLPDYANTVATTEQGYQQDLSQEQDNISQLNSIKDQVNAIITAAQQRRAGNRKANGLPAFSQACLAAEHITYVVNGVKK